MITSRLLGRRRMAGSRAGGVQRQVVVGAVPGKVPTPSPVSVTTVPVSGPGRVLVHRDGRGAFLGSVGVNVTSIVQLPPVGNSLPRQGFWVPGTREKSLAPDPEGGSIESMRSGVEPVLWTISVWQETLCPTGTCPQSSGFGVMEMPGSDGGPVVRAAVAVDVAPLAVTWDGRKVALRSGSVSAWAQGELWHADAGHGEHQRHVA